MEDITFTIKDKLPSNSLIRPLIEELFGETTIKYDETEECYLLEYIVRLELYITISNEIIEVDYKMKFMFLKAKGCDSFYVSSEIPIHKICAKIFTKCLLKIENDYHMKGITHDKVRKYPIYQLIENYIIYGSTISNYYESTWKGFTLAACDGWNTTNIKIKFNDKTIFCKNGVPLRDILEKMKSEIAPSVFYTESSIRRIKSAKSNIPLINC